ncbi:MAG TPA: hypothetical protein DEQ09_06810 [Bacteroidales bacterium]|nr:hypothetical protein [Bacteroidales bacterium]
MKVVKRIWWLPLVIYMTIAPSFMSDRVYNESCREIRITVMDSAEYRFVTPGEIMTIIQDDNTKLLGAGLNSINIKRIENILAGIRELESVEVYTTADGVLHVDTDQRDPVMRVITSYGNSYYIDNEGFVIPHNNTYTPRLIAVSGNIEVPDSCILGRSILDMDEKLMVNQIFEISRYINNDEFWNRLLEQIWINDKAEIELVPRVGDHIVKMGSAENYQWKFKVLGTFYKETLAIVGWDKYDEIDMRFKGQLVCRKK